MSVDTPRAVTRAAAPLAVSLSLHLLAFTGAVTLVQSAASAPPRAVAKPLLTFLALAPPRVVDLPAAHLSAPPPMKFEPEIDKPPAPRPPALPPPDIRRAELPVPPPLAPPRIARPAPPPIVVGSFPGTAAVKTNAPNAARPVHDAGFDAPAANAPDMKLAPAAVGAFDRSTTSARPQPGTDRPIAVAADSGFGPVGGAPPASAPPPRATADAGFGAAASARPQATSRAEVRPSGFADARAAQPAPRAEKATERVDTPVEVLFKPKPDYTDEARSLKLEGEVVLEIEFGASGSVRVLRVVGGLGHGLDETAARAAERIRFKPALSAGRPVGFKTTVHIVFRLT